MRLPKKPTNEPRPGDVIVISQTTVYYFAIAVLFFIAGFAVAWIVFSTTTLSAVNNIKADVISAVNSAMSNIQPGAVAQATETPVPRQNVTFDQAPIWGPMNAKVTIVEFSDFQCPYCEIFYKQTYPLIKQKYGNSVRFAFRHFPIPSLHPDAERASMAAECANEQGKFWEYHDALFGNQQNLSRDALIQYAGQVQVANIPQFTSCLDTQKYMNKVQTDVNAGMGYFVSGTPTFFINGNILVGAQSFQTFAKYIDLEMAQAGG
jgi:protein-disulfide isomerase